MNVKFLMSISLLAGFLSCSDMDRSDRLGRLDALMNSVDSMEVVLEEYDREQCASMTESIDVLADQIESLSNDTIAYDFAIQLDRFLRVESDLAFVTANVELLEMELKQEAQAIELLKNDIANENGKRDKYDEYIDFEAQKVGLLKEQLAAFLEKIQRAVDTFDELHVVLTEEVEARVKSEVQ